MAMRIGCGASEHPDVREGAADAARTAAAGLRGANADIAIVFAAGAHLAAPEATLAGVHETLAPASLIGCGAGGILAGAREYERGTNVVVWAASLPDGASVTTEHLPGSADADDPGPVPDTEGAAGTIILADPYSFASDLVLDEIGRVSPEVPVMGGLSSARTLDGACALFHDEDVVDGGAVSASFRGVRMHPCVSQGAAPVGPELTITAAEGHVIHELAGQPAIPRLREVVEDLPDHERAHLAAGLLLGLVIDPNKPDYEHGDFLVRGVLGGDPETGALAIGAHVRVGQVVRLHVRDATSADRDLRRALAGVPSEECAGALVFSCNGRGTGMFGAPDHDARLVHDALSGGPVAGFFAAGEIGPVGDTTFLHGFTATVALFGA
jgi:small ligand-binding sensory domain FIST